MSIRLNLLPGLAPPPALGEPPMSHPTAQPIPTLIPSPSVSNLIHNDRMYDDNQRSAALSAYMQLPRIQSPHSHSELEATTPLVHPIKKEHQIQQNHSNHTSAPPPSQTPTPTGQTQSNSSKTQTVFIHKLYDMLEDPTLTLLIWWTPPKFDSFCIQPGEGFSRALGQYFKHANALSFIRQLNMYGFHKVNELTMDDENDNESLKNKWEFRHLTNQFRKGDTESLKLIKRRSLKNINSHKEIVNLKLIPTSKPEGDYVEYIERSSYPFPATPTAIAITPGAATTQHHLAAPLPHSHHQQYPGGPTSGQVGASMAPLTPGPMQVIGGTCQSIPASGSTAAPQTQTSSNTEITSVISGLNSTVQTLRSELSVLQQKYDALSQHFQKSNIDMVHLIEFIEKIPRHNDGSVSAASTTSAGAPPINNSLGTVGLTPSTPAGLQPIDRSKARTPISTVEIPDSTTSPLSKASGSYEYELSKLKLLVLQRSHITQRNSSSTLAPIVPQPYPLNPHYTIHHHLEMDPNKRHLLVLMDPLQPIPSTSSPKADMVSLAMRKSTVSPLLLPFSGSEAKLAPGSILFSLLGIAGPPRLVPPVDATLLPSQSSRAAPERPTLLPLVLELDHLLKSGSLPVYQLLHSSDRPIFRKSMLDDEKSRLKRRRL